MGTSGMSYSLQSRDIIADSIETVSVNGKQIRDLLSILKMCVCVCVCVCVNVGGFI
jgi:dihydroxyacid dehydratase/phosphogluconate dehydratase